MKKYSFPLLYLVTGNYWSGMEYQRHHFARHFARCGTPVVFIERSPQRMPIYGIKDVVNWISQKGQGKSQIKKTIPNNIYVVNMRLLPPARFLRPLNRWITNRFLSGFLPQKNLHKKLPVVITYIPTYNTLDLIERLNPCVVAYINVHNYEAEPGMENLLSAEKELIKRCDVLFADSLFNVARLKKISQGKEVHRSLPGVNYQIFSQSYRGDEINRKKTLYYFGGIGTHLDLELYGKLCETVEVTFVGVLSNESGISGRIKILPPVSNEQLPRILKNADMLGLFYKQSEYVDGVVPAKFFECLATGKPVLCSGLKEMNTYNHVVYNVEGDIEKTKKTISELACTETIEKSEERKKIAQDADWHNRFKFLAEQIETAYQKRL